ncbi:DUF2931 family protein [Enterobacter sp.]|uniref:DUF2931 family protein n=1 Tax=Enterobacter sp. TaxID=42895 RepID=UPI00296EC600|nr:DUF2931 family protein [Enterobacter sp.]
MKKYVMTVLMAGTLLSGCHKKEPEMRPLQTDEAMNGDWALPYGQWRFAFTTPKALPATVTHVRIIDTDGYLYRFYTLDGTQSNPGSVGIWSDKIRRSSIHFNKANKPPQYMVFCWDSIIDKKTYETKIVFSPDTWLRMKTPANHLDRYDKTVWYDRMILGLAPEGKVRIWLQDVGDYSNRPVTPIKLETVSGDRLDLCKDISRHKKGYGYTQTTKDFIKDKTYPYGEW